MTNLRIINLFCIILICDVNLVLATTLSYSMTESNFTTIIVQSVGTSYNVSDLSSTEKATKYDVSLHNVTDLTSWTSSNRTHDITTTIASTEATSNSSPSGPTSTLATTFSIAINLSTSWIDASMNGSPSSVSSAVCSPSVFNFTLTLILLYSIIGVLGLALLLTICTCIVIIACERLKKSGDMDISTKHRGQRGITSSDAKSIHLSTIPSRLTHNATAENREISVKDLDQSVTLVHTYHSVDPKNTQKHINNESPRNHPSLEHISAPDHGDLEDTSPDNVHLYHTVDTLIKEQHVSVSNRPTLEDIAGPHCKRWIDRTVSHTDHQSSVNAELDKSYKESEETNPATYVNPPCPDPLSHLFRTSRPAITEFPQPPALPLTHHYFSAGDLP